MSVAVEHDGDALPVAQRAVHTIEMFVESGIARQDRFERRVGQRKARTVDGNARDLTEVLQLTFRRQVAIGMDEQKLRREIRVFPDRQHPRIDETIQSFLVQVKGAPKPFSNPERYLDGSFTDTNAST